MRLGEQGLDARQEVEVDREEEREGVLQRAARVHVGLARGHEQRDAVAPGLGPGLGLGLRLRLGLWVRLRLRLRVRLGLGLEV